MCSNAGELSGQNDGLFLTINLFYMVDVRNTRYRCLQIGPLMKGGVFYRFLCYALIKRIEDRLMFSY